jgi:DNA-binding transcriptional ArsR family regulator
MRPFAHPNAADFDLVGVLYALGDPARLAIVRALAEQGELSCASAACDLPKSTLSHHFAVLRQAGLIRSRRQGTHLLNTLRREEIDQRFPGLLAAVLQADRPVRKPRAAKTGGFRP